MVKDKINGEHIFLFVQRFLQEIKEKSGRLRDYLAYVDASHWFESKFGYDILPTYQQFKAVIKSAPNPKLKRGTHRQRAIYYGGHIEKVNRLFVFKRDGFVCAYCKRKVRIGGDNQCLWATIDHIVPLSLGGDHTYENVITSCFSCNSSKGNKRLKHGKPI